MPNQDGQQPLTKEQRLARAKAKRIAEGGTWYEKPPKTSRADIERMAAKLNNQLTEMNDGKKPTYAEINDNAQYKNLVKSEFQVTGKQRLLKLEAEVGIKEAKMLERHFESLSNTDKALALKMMLADDFPTILGMSIPTIVNSIPKLWGYAKTLGSHVKSGSGWVNGLKAVASQGLSDFLVPNNSVGDGISSRSQMSTYVDATISEVNGDFLKATILPGVYKAQYPGGTAETAVCVVRSELTLVSSTTGAAGLIYTPYRNWGVASSSPQYATQTLRNASDFDPLTGKGTAVFTGGQFSGQTASIAAGRVVGESYQIIFTQSGLAAQGKIEAAYWPNAVNPTFVVPTGPITTFSDWLVAGQNDILQRMQQYYCAGVTAGGIHTFTAPPLDPSNALAKCYAVGQDKVQGSTYECGATVMLCFTGLTPSVAFATVIRTTMMEAEPSSAGAPLMDARQCPPCIRTMDVWDYMRLSCPRLWCLSANERAALCKLLDQCSGTSYMGYIQAISNFHSELMSGMSHAQNRFNMRMSEIPKLEVQSPTISFELEKGQGDGNN